MCEIKNERASEKERMRHNTNERNNAIYIYIERERENMTKSIRERELYREKMCERRKMR